MRDVLDVWPHHLGAPQSAAPHIHVDVQQPSVAQHHPRAALVLGADHASDGAGRVEAGQRRTDHCHRRVGEHHRDRHTALTQHYGQPARRVLAGDATLVRRLMQQGQVSICVASDEDVRVAALQGVAVEQGDAACVRY
jgi:hypothetical protein